MPKKKPDPIDVHIGTRLRLRRRALDMSQTEAATAVGVTFQQLQKYERGANRISASRLQHLSQLLQVPIPFFFEGLSASDVGAARGAAEAAGSSAQSLARPGSSRRSQTCTPTPSPKLRYTIKTDAVSKLAALSQQIRFDLFRVLVKAGPEGMTAGAVADALDLQPQWLSFHLNRLRQAQLICSRREGRSIIYTAQFEAIKSLLAFLTENCIGRPKLSQPSRRSSVPEPTAGCDLK